MFPPRWEGSSHGYLTCALLMSWLDCCNVLWSCLWRHHNHCNWFKMLQAQIDSKMWLLFCRSDTGNPWFSMPHSRRWSLCISPSLYSLGLKYQKNCLTLHICAWPLRYLREGFLQLPSLADARLVAARERALLVVVPQLQNSVPKEVCLALSLEDFKKCFKDGAM